MGKFQIITLVSVILLILALGLFAIFLLSPQEKADVPMKITTTIPVLHQFKNGTHTYVGTLDVPTPCHAVFGEALVKESYPEQVDIRIETKESGNICAQVIATKKFKVSFVASTGAVVRAYVNGTPVLFKVTEVPGTANLEATEI